MSQTDALPRWAGEKSNLYPANDNDALICDEVIATSFDALYNTPTSTDEQEKKRLREEYTMGFLSTALTLLEKRVKQGNRGWRVANFSIGDLTLAMLTDMILKGDFDYVAPSLIVDNFPALNQHHKSVHDHEVVNEYLKHYPN